MKTEDQLNENSIVVKGLDPGQVGPGVAIKHGNQMNIKVSLLTRCILSEWSLWMESIKLQAESRLETLLTSVSSFT